MGLLREVYVDEEDYLSPQKIEEDKWSSRPEPLLLKILIIEDSDADYELSLNSLQQMDGYRVNVQRARNTKEAFTSAHFQKFDIIFVDFWLGDETSITAMNEFGGRFGDAAQILLSGMQGPDIRNIAIKAGAIHCIDKNMLNPVLLESTITSALYTKKIEAKLADTLDDMEEIKAVSEAILSKLKSDFTSLINGVTEKADTILEEPAALEHKNVEEQAHNIKKDCLELLTVLEKLSIGTSDK